MIERFVDTSGRAEWADHTLQFHAQAVEAFNEVWDGNGRLITTSLVLAELTALLARPLRMPKTKQIELLDEIRSDRCVRVVPLGTLLESAAWNLWRARDDKNWSLVDCASFVVMKQHGLLEALTTDRHFEQAGFCEIAQIK
jgi:predicted nucleic acid-binding protein